MRTVPSLLATLLLASTVLAGCVSPADVDQQNVPDVDEAAGQASSWAWELPATITGLEPIATAAGAEAGAGIWVEGDLAYVSGLNSGFYVVNLTTPEDPRVEAHLPELYSRDVDLLHYDGGNRTVAALAGSSSGMHFVDVTDPADPAHLSTVDLGVHNLAVVPGTHLVYNSRSLALDAPGTDVVDATDPSNPEVVAVARTGVNCHDITFRVTETTARAYCAGIEATQIWDIADPEAPEVVASIVNPAINIHHWAMPALDGKLLIIGDEHGGAAAYGCGAYVDNPVRPSSDTVGAVWFYDISDEMNPTPISWVSAPAQTDDLGPTLPASACTAHFGELVPGHDQLVVGWYIAGTVLIDFSDLVNPVIVDVVDDGGDVWDARVHNGFVFTGDISQGMGVLGFLGEDGGS